MPNLRALQVYHLHDYPLELLAGNASLGRLESLLLHPGSVRGPHAYIQLEQLRAVCRSPHLTSLKHLRLRLTDFGDSGAQEVVSSGLLRRVKVLDLRHGSMTDEGAKLLAGCDDLKNLDFLDLSRNALTEIGIAALRATGVRFDAQYQHGQTPGYDGNGMYYLDAGDCE